MLERRQERQTIVSIESHHQFILNTMQRHDDIARNLIQALEAENARLKTELAKSEEHNSALCERLQDLNSEVHTASCYNGNLHKENARLKAEVERYKFTIEEERQIARQDWAGLRCEHDRVNRALEQAEAEVERLRKAGDWMCGLLRFDFVTKEWNAAKEGKPSV